MPLKRLTLGGVVLTGVGLVTFAGLLAIGAAPE
jgi:hypothetical protein